MDETCYRINNESKRFFSSISWEEVVVDAGRNFKECFTLIGTCSFVKKKPLTILTKRTTEASKSKFRAGVGIEVWVTGNWQGLMNEEMMINYLNHLHTNYADIFSVRSYWIVIAHIVLML